jgi:hypothetical protein
MKQYCQKCILPEDYPGIRFNEEGVCNFCFNYETQCADLGGEKLAELIKATRKNGKFDCVVPLNGGKDSAYILYYAVKHLKLKAIAVTYDSGFQTEAARSNIRKVCKALNVPLVIRKSHITGKMLKLNLLIGKAGGEDQDGGDNKGNIRDCGNCEMMLRTAALRLTRKFNAPLIFWGPYCIENELSGKSMNASNKGWGKGWGKREWSFGEKTYEKFTNMIFTPRGKTEKYLRIFGWNIPPKRLFLTIRYQFWNVIQRISQKVPLKFRFASRGQIPPTGQNPKFVMCHDYVDFFNYTGGGNSPAENMRVLKEELGWRPPENKEHCFDCDIHWLDNYFHLQRNHISMDGAKFCKQIRKGQLTREEALIREGFIQESIPKECNRILKRIGLAKLIFPDVQDHISLKPNECLMKCGHGNHK